jgi:hypothetical protein
MLVAKIPPRVFVYLAALVASCPGSLTGGELYPVLETESVRGEETFCRDYLVTGYQQFISVYDIAVPTIPARVGFLDLREVLGRQEVAGLSGEGDLLVVAAGPLIVIGVGQDGTPAIRGKWTPESGDGYTGVVLSGGHAFCSGYHSGLHIIDLTVPETPAEDSSLSFPGVLLYDLKIDGPRAFLLVGIPDGEGLRIDRCGIRLVDVADHTAPRLLGSWKTATSWIADFAVAGNRLYAVTPYPDGLIHTIDIGDPAVPIEVGSIAVDSPHGCGVRGSSLYVDVFCGIQGFDISGPSLIPGELVTTALDPWRISIRNDLLFDISDWAFCIFSLSDPPLPPDVACSAEGYRLRVTWGPSRFERIEIQVDGRPEATVDASAGAYETDPLPAGPHAACLTGISGEERGWPACCGASVPSMLPGTFIRGDANRDGTVSISDVTLVTAYLFVSGGFHCMDAFDADDDGDVDLEDPIFLLEALMGGPIFPEPFPVAGADPTPEDSLGCDGVPGPAPRLDPTFAIEVGTVEGRPGDDLIVPIFASTPVNTDAVSLALTFEQEKIRIDGMSREGTILEGSKWLLETFRVDTELAFATMALFKYRPDTTWAATVLCPPLDRQVILYLQVHVLEDAAEGEALIVPAESVGSPPVRNEFSVYGDAVYAATYPKRKEGRVRIGPPLTIDIFRRGDADGNGAQELTDPIAVLSFLFLGGPEPGCVEAADADDDGVLTIADAVRSLSYLFLGFPRSLPAPFPACGPDATPSALGCRAGGCP